MPHFTKRTTAFAVILVLLTAAYLRPVHAQETEVWHLTSLENSRIRSLEATPWGLLAGEVEGRPWVTTHNGVYITNDLGETWEEAGLKGRAVMDLMYDKTTKSIYAATLDTIDNKAGLFVSRDGAKTWQHIEGLNIPVKSVGALGNTIIGVSNIEGAWISFDGGQNWEQKIAPEGSMGYSNTVKITDTAILVGLRTRVHKSLDGGHTWELEEDENGPWEVSTFAVRNSTILAGAINVIQGMYKSTDFGETWNKIPAWSYSTGYPVVYFKGSFFAGKRYHNEIGYTVWRSADNGETWYDLELNTQSTVQGVLDIAGLTAEEDYLFVAVTNLGVFRYKIPKIEITHEPIFEIPWDTEENGGFLDNVYSLFDHEYPLFGYSTYPEPTAVEDTIMDFLGKRGKPPEKYYSSHNGIDFTLDVGDEIKAPYPGTATYYYCKDCGHTIKIDHQNGYQTVYMHLQGTDLIVDNTSTPPVSVLQGDVIGRVGMTGNTTGPHLHFTVKKDTDGDGSFADEYPDGLVDPFGWQNADMEDPWKNLTWQDYLGNNHSGTESKYLWNNLIETAIKYFKTSTENQIELENKHVVIPAESAEHDFNTTLMSYIQPYIPKEQNELGYIANTSLLINAFDQINQTITTLLVPATIQIAFGEADLQNIILDTINIYSWDPLLQLWEPLTNTVLDIANNIVAADTLHFSQFAVFGQRIDSKPPTTAFAIEGSTQEEWFVEYPTVTLTTNAVASDTDLEMPKTYYLVGDDIDWIEYTKPVILEKEGVFGIEYKSVDTYGNWETSKDVLIKVDTQGLQRNTVKVIESMFQLQ